jgi:hypothetical protein
MAAAIGPVMAETQETRQRYWRLRAFNIAVGVLLAAEALYIPRSCRTSATPAPADAATMTFQRNDLAAMRSFARDQAMTRYRAYRAGSSGWFAKSPTPARLAAPATGTSLRRVEGQGLWMVTKVCDLVELRTGLAWASVRVRYDLA